MKAYWAVAACLVAAAAAGGGVYYGTHGDESPAPAKPALSVHSYTLKGVVETRGYITHSNGEEVHWDCNSVSDDDLVLYNGKDEAISHTILEGQATYGDPQTCDRAFSLPSFADDGFYRVKVGDYSWEFSKQELADHKWDVTLYIKNSADEG